MKLEVSTIIVNYNTREFLRNLLTNIQSLNMAEIIVVDNGSTDSSVEMVKNFFPFVKLIRNEENYGFAKACNIGIKSSRERFLLFLNTDIEIIDKNFLNGMLEVAKKEGVGIVGTQLLNKDGTKQHSAAWIRPFKIFYYAGNRIKDVDWVSGTCFLVKREILDKIGLFDENFFLYYEETDLMYRTKKHGYKIVIQPKAKVIHHGGETARKLPKNFLAYHWFKSRLYFFLKHRLMVHLLPRVLEDFYESIKQKNYIIFKAYKDAVKLIV